MSNLSINLQNLITGKKYSPSVSNGNGTLDLKGWDGVATGPNQLLNLSGTGVQKILTEMAENSYNWPDDNCNDVAKNYWLRFTGATQNPGFATLLYDSSHTSGGELRSNFKIAADEDFKFTIDTTSSMVPPLYQGGWCFKQSLTGGSEVYEFDIYQQANSGASPIRRATINGDSVQYNVHHNSVSSMMNYNRRFKRVGNILTIYHHETNFMHSAIVNPSVELTLSTRIFGIGTALRPTVQTSVNNIEVNYGKITEEYVL